MTYDDLPRMEHERRHRAKHEPDAANRVVTAEPEWQLPEPQPDVPPEHQPYRTEPRVVAFRIRNGLCIVCAEPTDTESHLCGGDRCQHDVIDRG